jgi:hypothetical protein
MIAGINLFENIIYTAQLAGIQINEIAARAVRIQCLVMIDIAYLITPALAEPVHDIHLVADFQIAKELAAQVIMGDQADISVARGKLEIRGNSGYLGNIFRFTAGLVYYSQKMASSKVNTIDIIQWFLGRKQLVEHMPDGFLPFFGIHINIVAFLNLVNPEAGWGRLYSRKGKSNHFTRVKPML